MDCAVKGEMVADDVITREAVYTLQGVAKSFRRGAEEVVALAGVDLEIARGELLLVMGPSGSGKSTLLHLLGGLDRPSAGSIRFVPRAHAAVELSALPDEELARLRRSALGFVFQEFHLLPTLTAEENAMLPLLLDGVAEKPARERARERLDRVGLSARREHLPDQLSGGERQRVAIARALVADPPVLLCDEPTGSLDSARGREILGLLRELVDREERTVVVVTHDANARPFAHREIGLRDGRLERAGT
jgi:putative ABC transport system ATP-binding protein